MPLTLTLPHKARPQPYCCAGCLFAVPAAADLYLSSLCRCSCSAKCFGLDADGKLMQELLESSCCHTKGRGRSCIVSNLYVLVNLWTCCCGCAAVEQGLVMQTRHGKQDMVLQSVQGEIFPWFFHGLTYWWRNQRVAQRKKVCISYVGMSEMLSSTLVSGHKTPTCWRAQEVANDTSWQ